MPNAKYTPEEVTSQGQTIYEQQIRDEIEPRYKGKFLVIDIETGVYEMDDDGPGSDETSACQLSQCRHLRPAHRVSNCLPNRWTLLRECAIT